MAKATLTMAKQVLANDYLLNDFLATKYSAKKDRLFVMYKDMVITLYYLCYGETYQTISGHIEGSITITCAGHLADLLQELNNNE